MSEQMMHTPGPWKTFGAHPATVVDGTVTVHHDMPVERWPIKRVYFDDQGRRVTVHFAEAYPCGLMSPEEVEANARLIAAAPTLLAAATAVVAQWDTPNWKLSEATAPIIDNLRAAIAEAQKL